MLSTRLEPSGISDSANGATMPEDLAEFAEEVTGLDARTLVRASRVGLLELALHAPQVGFGGPDSYPEFVDNAAVLVVSIVRSCPLPDANKQLAGIVLSMFCAPNGRNLTVALMLEWIEQRHLYLRGAVGVTRERSGVDRAVKRSLIAG